MSSLVAEISKSRIKAAALSCAVIKSTLLCQIKCFAVSQNQGECRYFQRFYFQFLSGIHLR